ncbi:MAG: BON domain-containing protein [Acidobacteriota bacterium]
MKRSLLSLAAIALLATACVGRTPTPETSTSGTTTDSTNLEDARLTTAVRLALLEKLGSDGMTIEPEVRGDRAFLTGTVQQRSSQELAEEVAASVRGVRRVKNRIKVAKGDSTALGAAVSDAEREVRDALLETRIKGRLLSEVGRFGLEIEVECVDGVASLRGWLPDPERKRFALSAAESTPGVNKVIDLLRVGLE